jgi:hypothetical protein
MSFCIQSIFCMVLFKIVIPFITSSWNFWSKEHATRKGRQAVVDPNIYKYISHINSNWKKLLLLGNALLLSPETGIGPDISSHDVSTIEQILEGGWSELLLPRPPLNAPTNPAAAVIQLLAIHSMGMWEHLASREQVCGYRRPYNLKPTSSTPVAEMEPNSYRVSK